MITTYKQALEYLEQFIPFMVDHSLAFDSAKGDGQLARMKHLLKLLDNPQEKFPSIVVSGTSGKGSVCYLISNILTSAGYRTGFTLSPHLQRITERVQIGDRRKSNTPMLIADKEFISLLNVMIPKIEAMRESSYGPPSYYEILLSIALLAFKKEKVDIAVVEVGLEGKYDATNLISPLIFVLTNISLDHTNILGDTIEKIADEATFRIKSLEPFNAKNPLVITGVTQPSVIKLVKQRCTAAGIKVRRLHKDFDYRILDETRAGVEFVFLRNGKNVVRQKHFFVSLKGAYQAENACLAIEVMEGLKDYDFKIRESDIHTGLKTASFPGRFEIVQVTDKSKRRSLDRMKYTIILDGAHNPAKIRAFFDALQKLYPKSPKIFVVGFKKDKVVKDMLKAIVESADMLIITKFISSMDWGKNMGMDVNAVGKQLAQIKKTGLSVLYEANVTLAMAKAEELSYANWLRHKNFSDSFEDAPLIVVTGSLYLVGEVRELLQQE